MTAWQKMLDSDRPNVQRFTALLQRLTPYKVTDWKADSDDDNQTPNRLVDHIESADVISSLLHASDDRHQVVLDIDHPAWTIESTTEGHCHLYIDVPGGIAWNSYVTMMEAMRDAGVLQAGFVRASIAREHSDVRLPWVKKEQTDGA